MGYWLAGKADQQARNHVKRFDPTLWTINFPRPMMGSIVSGAHDTLRADLVFYRADDLAGLIWDAEDVHDHPLLSYETSRDFRHCVLEFRWSSHGLVPLGAAHGPTLTIEGRDEAGNSRIWYVSLWDYADGTPEDAALRLDFDSLEGTIHGGEGRQPVWAGDVDRMFISLVPEGYAPGGGVLPSPVEAWVELSDISCDGSGSVLVAGDTMVPAHGLRIATGYDDCYHLTPTRLIRNLLHLGYRGIINHYVGMSHYYRLAWDGSAFRVAGGGEPLNQPMRAWHASFLELARRFDYEVILSLSYELLDANTPEAWKQRTEDGEPALTGWLPPSTLLSPANEEAMGYLQSVGRSLAVLALGAGQRVRFQIGEPWWWVTPDYRICLYDDAARQLTGSELVSIPDARQAAGTDVLAVLDAAGAVLATSTAALGAAVRDVAPDAELLLLAYLPTILDRRAPELVRANLPVGWASPAFDVLQLEDYDWVTAGNSGATRRGVAAAVARLGYPEERQHYLSGFVLNPADRHQWRLIEAAAGEARRRGCAEVFIWALPQVLRDGFTHFDEEEKDMLSFDDVDFPIAIGQRAIVEPGFSTALVTTASGHEQRNADWADARMRYDVAPGVRSEEDAQALIGFFRSRRGRAKGFRFRDPFDDSSSGMTREPGPTDQQIGLGDGIATRFQLIKRYGVGDEAQERRISCPVADSVRVALDGVEQSVGWSLEAGG